MSSIVLESRKLESLMAVTKQISLLEDTVNVGEIDVDSDGNYNAVLVGEDDAVANVANKYANAANVKFKDKTSDELQSIAAGKIGELITGFSDLQEILDRMDTIAAEEDNQWHLNEEGDNLELPALHYNLFMEDEKYILSMPNERMEFETESDLLRYIVENKLPKLDKNEFRMLHAPIPTGQEIESDKDTDAKNSVVNRVNRVGRNVNKESVYDYDYDAVANQLRRRVLATGRPKSDGSGRKWISDKSALNFVKQTTNTTGAEANKILAQVLVRLPHGMIFDSVREDAAAGVTTGMSIAPGVLLATPGKMKSKNKKSKMRETIENLLR